MTLTKRYEHIDKVLDDWLPKYGLTVYKEYKDEPVRAISVVDDTGDRSCIWLTSDANNKIKVSAHDPTQGKKGQSWQTTTDKNNLTETLDKAYMQIDKWIKDKGHKRTWY